MQFVATVAKGLEPLMVQELQSFGANEVHEGNGFVRFDADWQVAYRSCLWSRFASRILWQIAQGSAHSADELYRVARQVNWPGYFSVQQKFAVRFSGQNRDIRNTQFGALKIKDAIVDCFNEQCGKRPDVDKLLTDVVIHGQLYRDNITLYLDLCGDPLHQRCYRQKTGAAPLKENLAAAIVARSGWDMQSPLIDPMCGSGTLLIEAAMMATDTAPGLFRDWFALTKLCSFDEPVWQSLLDEASERHQKGRKSFNAPILGRDINPNVIKSARRNTQAAGLNGIIEFEQGDLMDLQNPFDETEKGAIISNPPYGERIGEIASLTVLFHRFGLLLKQQFSGWKLSLFTNNSDLLSLIRMRSHRKFKLFNGAIECEQKNYDISGSADPNQLPAQDFANRLAKNIRNLKKWVKQEQIECYRLYDADLPEFNVAIDRYGDHLVIQEYAPPKTIDQHRAAQRFYDLVAATSVVCEVAGDKIILKQRRKQQGSEQYERLNENERVRFPVSEYGAKYWVDLTSYLDCGLFIDHRNMRRLIRESAKDKRFLNLFAYTGSVSVQAALGGAERTVTVDMSRTYLDWAKDNFALNGIKGPWHQFVQANCIEWLSKAREKFDLIFVDPPTFSNSKRMDSAFDVQRDHLDLLGKVSRLLEPDGICYFSNNKRHFKMDFDGLAQLGLQAENITHLSHSKDFERDPHIHNCWKVTWVKG